MRKAKKKKPKPFIITPSPCQLVHVTEIGYSGLDVPISRPLGQRMASAKTGASSGPTPVQGD